MKLLAVSSKQDDDARRVVRSALGAGADVAWLADLDGDARADALRRAGALLAHNTDREIADDELGLLRDLALVQFTSAGVDFVSLDRLPPAVPVAGNGGAYAEPMAEHALAMILAAAKRLRIEQENLRAGAFNQFTPTRMLRGMTVGILGFGGIGVATARLLRTLGVRVHAINRRGASDEPVDWIGTVDALDELLAASDALVLSLPLTARSERLIDAAALARMKPDAMLVNLARGEIVDETALYEHLRSHPDFTACIDAWWVEPVRHGEFRMSHPFLDLPNVLASPHNSASVDGWRLVALERAVRNCARALTGETPMHLVGDDERAPRIPSNDRSSR